jgi:hypothetical protein
MIRIIVLLFFLLSVTFHPCLSGGFAINNVTEINKKTEGEFSFPILSNAANAAVAIQINEILQLLILEIKIGKQANSIFENIWPVEDTYGVQSMGYRVFVNDDYLFSIGFFYETLSSYPDYSEHYYTFNAQNGDLLELNDLFTSTGFSAFDKRIRETHRQRIKESDSVGQETVNDLLSCAANQNITKFYVTPGEIAINYYGGRCLPHVTQVFDIDWNVISSSEQIKNLLNDFGKEVLIEKTKSVKDTYHKRDERLVARGLIDGKYPFLLYMDFDYFSKHKSTYSGSGKYWYDKVGEVIDLQVSSVDKVNFTLNEKDKTGKKRARFDLVMKGGKLSGTWTDLEKSIVRNVQFK